ncbi:MAG: 16S rRNA (guanine(966)-N(2))-methyltransferase RsmD [Candidatus Hydrogenedentota bacterium]
MRIIAGKSGGLTLTKIKGIDIRPTPDRVRESVFNILRPELDEETVFVDLFCGTGVNGLEALSRGVRRSIFVDKSADSLEIVRKNAEKIGVSGDCEIVRGSIPGKLSSLSRRFASDNSGAAWIIYADPPYDFEDYLSLLEGVLSTRWVGPECLLMVEHEVKAYLPSEVGSLHRYREESYGRTQVSFYRNEVSAS